MVGDRLETDLRMGQEAGMLTAVPLTGVSTREDISRSQRPPDFIIDGLHDLLRSSAGPNKDRREGLHHRVQLPAPPQRPVAPGILQV